MGLMDFIKKIGQKNETELKISAKTKTKTAAKVKKAKKSAAKVSKIKKPKKPQKSRKSAAAVKKSKKPAKKSVPEKSKEKIAGVIIHYFGKINVGIIKLKAELKVGDKIHIKGAHDDFTQVVKSMQFDHKPLSRAPKGKEIGILVSQRVHEKDKVYFAEK
ncbi:MAG: hypothetical protein ABII75_04015 [Candidatus Omnitrophota bacterium]